MATDRPRFNRLSGAISPLTRRILAVNLVALFFLVAGMLYLDEHRRGLIDEELLSLRGQANLFAAAVAEGATVGDTPGSEHLNPLLAQQMVRRLVQASGTRARLYDEKGRSIADSLLFKGPAGVVEAEELPPPADKRQRLRDFLAEYDRLIQRLWAPDPLPVYVDNPAASAKDFPEVQSALAGTADSQVRRDPNSSLILSVAVPVQRYTQVIGALMLTRDSAPIDAAMVRVRLDILKWFAIALGLTILLSLYLAWTIAYPIRRLAAAAERVRRDRQGRYSIPDFSNRSDEIGRLGAALKEMTEALWLRMDAIERFAADVAHEIKNPLTSLRSAVETAARINDPERRQKLMNIIQEDVGRLDRLITDISDASRLDAELSRAKSEPVDIGKMLKALVDVTETAAAERDIRLLVEATGNLTIGGIEGRLVQVFRNLIANALSFSPRGGTIRLKAFREGRAVVAEVLDEGPGIPEGREGEIFQRFYSLRPSEEKFGVHSGLGLSISKQIVEAHGGSIAAMNRCRSNGDIAGACFTVRLPVTP
ncbi:stimulus-sensing domain-containing protein [Defluviicoccus vanus]|uniref:stimulus-sensing domain-containing protein n=1 Tax=Defluviicoccus vanus TaxID=111831 RepID=UPI001CBA673D|nr:stimulus-sensing domain-containing protein [Defluviicoccus vanus]